ncbi:hypothetical protein [Mucilaginibacter psychrotolerans]|uniref:DUF1018 domain-containing protein n=1 Tax=Mucilaginibacter psychrotolerans TaxID=1524096 RepID=A0A4Y8SA34_9SPHI|nr:hypothetical protein [Mucilaginibacter psychrotolerans]TFF35226.1 hypothetical protein E2R66_19885 [Mucilaginibacter psychrotolerans]
MNTAQITKVRTLLSKAGFDEKEKKVFVKQLTGGRTDSLKAMNYQETQEIIQQLEGMVGQAATPLKKPGDDMRNKILSRAHEMHWELLSGKVDMERVNNWCIRYSGKNKPLNQFTVDELPTLVTQFERAYQSFLNGI